jgi:16S rRNA processing protein RimM
MAGTSERSTIASVRFQQGRPIVALAGVETMDDAEALAGAELKVPEAELPPLPGGRITGTTSSDARSTDTDGQAIGRVTAVDGPLERSRLVVARTGGELLVPMVDKICIEVDPGAKRIVIDPPEGLLDL